MKKRSNRAGLLATIASAFAAPLLVVAVLALGAGCASTAGGQAVELPALAVSDKNLPPLSEIGGDDVLFSAMDRDWTRDEFEGMTRFLPPPSLQILNELEVPFEQFTPAQMSSGIGEVVTNLAAGEAARDRGMELPSQEDLEALMRDISIRMWLRHHGVIAATNVTDEDVAEFRDENREALMQEETLRLRHMFFPAYEEVTVEEGDTLVSISERINGDGQKASHILALETREPRAGKDAPDTGQTEPDEPLAAGETLLVPMGEERAAEVEAKAVAAWERLVAGEDFVEVAREATGNPNSAGLLTVKPAKDEKPMLPQLREAFDSVGDGEFSEPVRTRHGFQVVYRESYQPHRLLELDEVSARHLMDIRERKAFAAYMATLRELWKEYDGLEIDEEALMSAGSDDADLAKVIFTVESGPYRVGNFAEDFDARLGELEDVQARRDVLIDLRPLQEKVMMWDIARMGIREWRDYELTQQLAEATLLTPGIIEEMTQERVTEPTEEELRERFVKDTSRYTNVPSAFVWRISVTADTDAEPGTEEYRNAARTKLQELSRILSEIEDVSHFERIAREMSEDEYATMGGRVGRVNSFQDDGYYAPIIERMEGRGPVGPIIKGRDLQGYWVEEVFSTSETAFRDVRDRVYQTVVTERRQKLVQTIEQEFREEAGLKVMFSVEEEEWTEKGSD